MNKYFKFRKKNSQITCIIKKIIIIMIKIKLLIIKLHKFCKI